MHANNILSFVHIRLFFPPQPGPLDIYFPVHRPVCFFLPKRMKATPNWWHWILFSVPAVSPHPASVWQTHHPSHRKSPLTGPAAASSWSSFIIPADWLAERRADRWGRSPAGDLAGAKPWPVLCMNGGPGRMGEESLSLHRDKRRLGVVVVGWGGGF